MHTLLLPLLRGSDIRVNTSSNENRDIDHSTTEKINIPVLPLVIIINCDTVFYFIFLFLEIIFSPRRTVQKSSERFLSATYL